MWRTVYPDGYLGAFPEQGFSCPLLAQIAEELQSCFPPVFRGHPLLYLWAFKYDSQLGGTIVHADEAAVNLNFWITPDEANLDPESGGLVIWDKAAPPDWDFAEYNGEAAPIREFLTRSGAGVHHGALPVQSRRDVRFGPVPQNRQDRLQAGLPESPHQHHPALWPPPRLGSAVLILSLSKDEAMRRASGRARW